MQFNMLISWATSPEWMKTTWYLHESYTFLKLRPGADVHVLEAGFPALAEKYKNGPVLKELTWAIHLAPLADIHLSPAKQYEIETKGNRMAVRFLGVMAFFPTGRAVSPGILPAPSARIGVCAYMGMYGRACSIGIMGNTRSL
jgi:hypothetical protein